MSTKPGALHNSLRRCELVKRFDLAEREGRGLRGVLVHIEQSPFDVPDAFADSQAWPPRRERARGALAVLAGGDEAAARAQWTAIARENARVKTTLSRIPPEAAARLLRHAYVLAMVNAHVILGHPLGGLPAPERFEAMLDPAGSGPPGALATPSPEA